MQSTHQPAIKSGRAEAVIGLLLSACRQRNKVVTQPQRSAWSKTLIVPAMLVFSGAAGASDRFDRVAGVLKARCIDCHQGAEAGGGVSLRTADALMAGGYVVPGDSPSSPLIDLITTHNGRARMPKDAPPLSPDEVAAFRKWIEEGAAWPAERVLGEQQELSFDWWSYQPIKRPAAPSVRSEWVKNPIDAFVLAKLTSDGLAPGEPADRRTLLRRVTYDLTGLPPTPEEVQAFIRDSDPLAYERVVDRLLASSHYGERFARRWLDVVKYADTHGYDKDKPRTNAWPYRDYVIRSFNDDKPYWRFVQEQIAGDTLFPNEADGVIGMGFLVAGPWDFIGHVEVPESKIDGQVARNLDRDDMVANVMNTFCSVTVQCARCHDHKFDPILQDHYYGLQSLFADVDRADRTCATTGDEATEQLVYSAATHFEPEGSFKPTEGKLRAINVLHRGDVQKPLRAAVPGALPLGTGERWRFDEASKGPARRVALARWLTDDNNPLVWRSIVNRVWQHHFGRGIVATPNDFGRMGAPPTHPELLDWLAAEFRDQGQSFKTLHKLMVCSSTYRQASKSNPQAMETEGGSLLFSRMSRRRLDAEEVRDSILEISGALDRTKGGPGDRLFKLSQPEHSPHYDYHEFDPSQASPHRRSIYRFIVRSQPDPWMTTLDCADSSKSTPVRDETLTPLQALTMMNSPFNLAMSKRFAARLTAESDDLAQQVDRAMQLVVLRHPSPEEQDALVDYAQQHGLANMCRWMFNLSEFVYVD